MTNNDDTFRWDCIKGTRAIKDEISAELNAMTPEERHLYFEQINKEARDFVRDLKREKEKI
jgi:hypothetical protein